MYLVNFMFYCDTESEMATIKQFYKTSFFCVFMFSWFCAMHQSILPDFLCFIVDTLLLRNLQRSWETAQKYRFCNVNAAKSNFEALWYIIQISLLGFCKDLLRWQYVQIPRANITFGKNCLQYLWWFIEMFCKKGSIPFHKLFTKTS